MKQILKRYSNNILRKTKQQTENLEIEKYARVKPFKTTRISCFPSINFLCIVQ